MKEVKRKQGKQKTRGQELQFMTHYQISTSHHRPTRMHTPLEENLRNPCCTAEWLGVIAKSARHARSVEAAKNTKTASLLHSPKGKAEQPVKERPPH